ncbi:MAG: hypothetical protein ABIK33_05635 [candidate division WOR-3 bacterium]
MANLTKTIIPSTSPKQKPTNLPKQTNSQNITITPKIEPTITFRTSNSYKTSNKTT